MAAPAMPRDWQEERGTYIRLPKRRLGGGKVGHPTRGDREFWLPGRGFGVVGSDVVLGERRDLCASAS
jgi:hypothetical protein